MERCTYTGPITVLFIMVKNVNDRKALRQEIGCDKIGRSGGEVGYSGGAQTHSAKPVFPLTFTFNFTYLFNFSYLKEM